MSEPKVTINGVELTEAQAMVVRCALAGFTNQMFLEVATGSWMGADPHGKAMTIGYADRLREIHRLIYRAPDSAEVDQEGM